MFGQSLSLQIAQAAVQVIIIHRVLTRNIDVANQSSRTMIARNFPQIIENHLSSFISTLPAFLDDGPPYKYIAMILVQMLVSESSSLGETVA